VLGPQSFLGSVLCSPVSVLRLYDGTLQAESAKGAPRFSARSFHVLITLLRSEVGVNG
jgi:hypothetical protein